MRVKVKIKDIKPNPFRNIANYPIDEEKIEALKASINDTSFWDNILARKNSQGEIEIAYGHHRIAALKQLGWKEMHITVQKLDDATMLRVMANENLEVWKPTTAVLNETIAAAKEFLDKELAKYGSWKEFRSNKSIRPIFDSEPQFRSAKGKGVGQTTILKFLGGPWKQFQIQQALAILTDDEEGVVDRKAVELFTAPTHAEAFRKAVKESHYRDKLPPAGQQKLVAKVRKELKTQNREATAANIRETVQNFAISSMTATERGQRFRKLVKSGVSKKEQRELELQLLKPKKLPKYRGPQPKVSDLAARRFSIVFDTHEEADLFRKHFPTSQSQRGSGVLDNSPILAVLEGLESRKPVATTVATATAITDMHIYIPTLGRIDKQKTLDCIPSAWLPQTRLVVAEEEAEQHIEQHGDDLVLVAPVNGISATRQWIIENALSRYVMFLDDDMHFAYRHKGVKLKRAEREQVGAMFKLLYGWLTEDGFAHIGVSQRAGNNRIKHEYKEITRMNNAYAYDTEVLLEEGIRFDAVPLMQDFHVTLSLLRAGYRNRVTYRYAWSQTGSNTDGGCSTYRTDELMRDTAKKLAELHKPFVKVVNKRSKTSWKGMPTTEDGSTVRVDVNIQWKKAYRARKNSG